MSTHLDSSLPKTEILVVAFPNEVGCSGSTKKAILVALGIMFLIGTAIAAGYLYLHVGYHAWPVLGGLIPGIVLMAVGCCMKAKAGTHRRVPVTRDLTQQKLPEETTAAWRERVCKPQVNPYISEAQWDTSMTALSIIAPYPDRMEALEHVRSCLDEGKGAMTAYEAKSIGALMGLVCGDSAFAPYEFLPYSVEEQTKTHNSFGLEPGQWTDDSSMALCLADDLLENIREGKEKKLDEAGLMRSFIDWWYHGYNNAFTGDTPMTSVGLGGNISESFAKFTQTAEPPKSGEFRTDAGDIYTSGNGSLMRLAPVVIAARDIEEATALAYRQSKVTHRGLEAGECCRLMAFIMYEALHTEKSPEGFISGMRELINESFETPSVSVKGLASSAEAVENPKTKKSENWNWQDEGFTFNADRLRAQPGYIGSYAMDGLAMALHCVYTTDSFEAAVTKAGKHGGDADTLAAITGQIAGAIYGFRAIPKEWVDHVRQWDRNGEIATRAYLLAQANKDLIRE